MDLNKDNRDIYTIDSENYSEYMQDNLTERRDLLGTFIKFLLFILLLVFSYFFYNIVKYDLSFSEVFNKKGLQSTYELLTKNDKEIYVEKKEYVETLAKNIPKILTETTKVSELPVSKNHDEVIVKEIEKKEVIVVRKEVEIVNEVKEVSEPLIVESIKEVEEEVVLEVMPTEPVEVEKETIVKSVPVEILTDNEVSSETKLSENYLDRMVAELNSI